MENKFLEQYILQALNLVLGSIMQGETSYTNSFAIKVLNDGILFIPRLPAAYIMDDEFYQKIFKIVNVALYPRYTLLKQPSSHLVALETDDIHLERALFFPWMKGISERLIISDLEMHANSLEENKIPIMKNLSINYNNITSVAIAGSSGSGKSYTLTYFLEVLKHFSQLIIVDPKFDSPSRWARDNGFEVIHPQKSRSKSDFVAQVNESLSQCLETIQNRQIILYSDPKYNFEHITFVIDELLALTEGVNKNLKDSFFSLLSQIALLGRATKVHLLLSSQRFDHQAIPVSVREQLNVMIQVGSINKKTTQFLFPDLDPEGIVIPAGKGTGLIQVIDQEHPFQVLPLLTPTYRYKGEDHA
ncbi:cell division protein FtsK [Aerococcus urinaeequi]|uniref:cell division protein FtsK n=1 Tax=Aerococcus urinaeequi TaxID=51665 RepID=UPI003EC4C856